METRRRRVMRLLDRALIALLIFIVMLLLGIQVVSQQHLPAGRNHQSLPLR